MFATAERRSRPKIFIFTYPGIRKVSCCSLVKSPNRYLSNAFAGTDYLLTLTDFPSFQIILWLWRTGERLTAIDTKITDHDQRIACSPSAPYLLSQIGKNTGELAVYEIAVCSKIISMVPVGGASALTTNTVSVSWTPDGNLLHCDYGGNVTLISSDGKRRYLIVRGEDDTLTLEKSPLIEAFRTGVVLVNKKSQILFYRKLTGSNRVKSGCPWKSVWSVQATSHPTWILRCPFRDGALLLCTERREIFELSIDEEDDTPRLRVVSYLGWKYAFLTSINPLGGHVAAIDGSQRLDILQCITGHMESNLCLKTYGQGRSTCHEQKGFQGLNMTEAIRSGHQLRNIRININSSFVVTCSYDGLIIVRSKAQIHQVLKIFMTHHRQEGGAKTAIFSGDNNTFVCLGRNGDLIATKICYLEVVSHESDGGNSAIYRLEYRKEIAEDDLTYVERSSAVNFQEEQEKCAPLRYSILHDFANLQKRLKLLLDTNDLESINAKLSISDFDLDRVTRSEKLHGNLASQKDLSSRLEKEIFQQDEVAKYLRKLCWNSMQVPACSIISVIGKTMVDNFPISRVSKFHDDCRKWETFNAEFRPGGLNKERTMCEEVFKSLSIEGTTTHRWIPEIPILLSNRMNKFASYVEGRKLCMTIRDQERRLKMYFNKIFEDMLVVKEHELVMAAERIDEIRHCASELKNIFGVERSNAVNTLQPLWHYSEKPETIVTVTNDEISSGRAVTFLERNLRLATIRKRKKENFKLYNNFREAALEVMMDGLLEVRWEDEIKKDPPKPLCLSNKDPSIRTEEEVAAVEMYRRKCQELKFEREKYKKMLENKISTVQEALRQDANAFDQRLAVFYLDRMKIESAVFQETLMRLRESQRHSMRRQGMKMQRLACNELESASKAFRNLLSISTNLEVAVNDTRNRYDNFTKRDKLLEGKLRGEFPSLKQPMVEHLLRQYRKRPRNVQFTCTSVTYLTEIARCLVNGEKSEILPRDCLEFLRGMDSLDVMPNNLPAQIDASHWQLLCKLRRAKVELEIKMKSCAVDLAEAEQTLVLHQKSCLNAEAQLSQLKETTKEREVEHSGALKDTQVQLVLKMGQIECRLCGDPSELSNSVLVPSDVVERANNKIIDAGREKVTAMRKSVQFRRTTLWQEWSHKCMRITLQNMREELKILQGVKVTKEIRYYLQSHSRSVGAEKEANIQERIVESTKKIFQRMLQEKKRQLTETSDKATAWRKQNERLVNAIEKTKLASFKASMVAQDGTRKRDVEYRRGKLKTIMKRTRHAKKIQDNYVRLLALQTQLELFRLKTYPTLRLKGLAR